MRTSIDDTETEGKLQGSAPSGASAARARLGALLLAALFLSAACGEPGRGPQEGLDFYELVRDGRHGPGSGLRFAAAARAGPAVAEGERRPAVLTAARGWSWEGVLPREARLDLGLCVLPSAAQAGHGLEVVLDLRHGRRTTVLEVLRPRAGRTEWLDLSVDLSPWAGKKVRIESRVRSSGPVAAAPEAGAALAWAPLRLGGGEADSRRPNILLIVVDTLRRDRLTPYGYPRRTSPNLERWVARHGLTLLDAYAQASWTLPSMASLMTGAHPGEVLGEEMESFGIEDPWIPLAETLRSAGYRTAGFVANPLLHEANGFGRGFETFYSPEGDMLRRVRAQLLTRRALPWLAAHARGRPFFLYLHYLDPHDPYDSPELVAGRSPFLPDYSGSARGDLVHDLFLGQAELEEPAADVEHLSALYDSEIRHADRWIGHLLAAIPKEILAETLVVVTSDHGEELHDHGGWGHSRTVYEEVIRVPLLLRWDGRIPAGGRLPGVVRLLDLAPTLAAAAGIEAEPGWRGVDLLPYLSRGEKPPPLVAFAEHLYYGPRRGAVVSGGRKLTLFDRDARPRRPLPAVKWEYVTSLDHRTLPRAAVYDLDRDPGEREGRSPSPEEARLQRLLHARLDARTRGLRLVASALPVGGRLRGRLRFERPPEGWASYFLDAGDRVRQQGSELRFEWVGDGLEKGIHIHGEPGRLLAFEAELAGSELTLWAGEKYWRGEPVEPAALLLRQAWPSAAAGPVLRLWARPEGSAPRALAVDPETRERLEALGYARP